MSVLAFLAFEASVFLLPKCKSKHGVQAHEYLANQEETECMASEMGGNNHLSTTIIITIITDHADHP